MNQSSTVELILKVAKAVNPMRQVQKESKKTEEAIRRNRNAFEALSRSAEKIQKSIERSQGSFATGSRIQATFSARVLNTEKAMRAQIRALRQVQSTVKFNGALYKKAGAEIARYEAILKSANKTTDEAKQKNNGFAAGLGKLAVAFGAARAAQATLQAGIRRDESERRLRLLTERFGETAEAQAAAQRAADKFNLSQTEANVQLSRLIARLRPMGLSMATIETAFAGFNTATILAGATASESAGAFLQLSQALGSGVLRGQELNSILEQAPLIAQAIALEMGVAVGALKKLGEEGEITSDIVIKALGRVERDGADQLSDALKGPAAAIKNFQNAAEDVQVALTQDIIPEMAKSFRELADLIRELGPLFRLVGGGVGGVLGAANRGIEEGRSLFRALTEPGTVSARADIKEGRLPLNVAGASELIGRDRLQELREIADVAVQFGGRNEGPGSQRKVLLELLQKEIGMFALPGRTKPDAKTPKPTPLTREQKKGIATAGDIFQQQTRALAILEEESDLGKKLLQNDHRRADVIAQINGLEGIGKERRQEIIDITNRAFDAQEGSIIGQALGKDLVAATKLGEAQEKALLPLEREQELLTARLNGNEEEILQKQMVEKIMNSVKGLNEDDVKAQVAKVFSLREQVTEAERLEQLYARIGQTIETQIVDSLLQAKSASEALSNVLNMAANELMRFALGSFNLGGEKGSGSGIFGAIADIFRANGGPVKAGRSYIVGERGPEVFTPGVSGGITPNHAMGGSTSIVVNVDASGSSVEGDADEASQLGRMIGAAVQSELIRQQRPGGLLAR